MLTQVILLTDSRGSRRALELGTCPPTSSCPEAGGGVWPRAGTNAREAFWPLLGPGTGFGPGQGWEPCRWGGTKGSRGAKNCGKLEEQMREGSREASRVDRGDERDERQIRAEEQRSNLDFQTL